MTLAPYYAHAGITLYAGDATDILSRLPVASVDCVVTSPPYWGLRDYGTGTWTGGNPDCVHSVGRGTNTLQARQRDVPYPAGAAHRGGNPAWCRRCGARRIDRQLGLEPTVVDYIDNLRQVFAQLWRVLADHGTCWLNLGDTYSAAIHGSWRARQASTRRLHHRPNRPLPRKTLVGMPWRVALALQADGWLIRNSVAWHKPNAMPGSVRDRLSCRHETIFLLVKQQRYYFDLDPIREPLARPGVTNVIGSPRKGAAGCLGASRRRRGTSIYTAKYASGGPFIAAHGAAMRPTGARHTTTHPGGKNPGDVWSIPTRPLRAAHFATFPIDVPLRCIAAGCPPGGHVLDPFSGAATTGLAARQLGRTYTGIDLNPTFHDLGLRRLYQTGHSPDPCGATGTAEPPEEPHA